MAPCASEPASSDSRNLRAWTPRDRIQRQTGNGVKYAGGVSDMASTADQYQIGWLGYFFLASSAGLKAARASGRVESVD